MRDINYNFTYPLDSPICSGSRSEFGVNLPECKAFIGKAKGDSSLDAERFNGWHVGELNSGKPNRPLLLLLVRLSGKGNGVSTVVLVLEEFVLLLLL